MRIVTQRQLLDARGVRAPVIQQLVSHILTVAIANNLYSLSDYSCAREALTLATRLQSLII
jgi:hypothetical protein